MGAIDDYLQTLDAARRAALEHVVEVARRVAPDAVDGRSYGVAALLVDGRPLLGVRAAAGHLALYPFSPPAVAVVADRLDARQVSKGTVRFTVEKPLPGDVIEDLVRARLTELTG